VRDAALPQQATTTRVAVALVRNQPLRTAARASTPTRTGYPNAIQDSGKLRTVVTLPSGDDDRERTPFAVAGQMKLGGESASAAP
jgi:hypothetical protein